MKRKCIQRKKLIHHVQVTKRLLLKNVSCHKTNVLVDDHKQLRTCSQQIIDQIGVIEEVVSPKLYKLNLSLTKKNKEDQLQPSPEEKRLPKSFLTFSFLAFKIFTKSHITTLNLKYSHRNNLQRDAKRAARNLPKTNNHFTERRSE